MPTEFVLISFIQTDVRKTLNFNFSGDVDNIIIEITTYALPLILLQQQLSVNDFYKWIAIYKSLITTSKHH